MWGKGKFSSIKVDYLIENEKGSRYAVTNQNNVYFPGQTRMISMTSRGTKSIL